MKGRAASLEFLFLREKVPFACCVGEMGFALLYRGAGFCLRRAETGKAGMFRPFSCPVWKAQRDGVGCTWRRWLLANIYLYLKGIFMKGAPLRKRAGMLFPEGRTSKEAIMIDFKVDESLCVSCGACVKKIVCIRLSAWTRTP